MENKLFKYIIIIEMLLIVGIFGTSFLSAIHVGTMAMEEAGTRIVSQYEIISLPFGWLYQLDTLPGALPPGEQHNSLCDMFVTPVVWLLTSCLWAGILYGIIRLLRRKGTETDTRKNHFWKKVFLSNLLISIVAFLFIFLFDYRYLHTASSSENNFYPETFIFTGVAIAGAFLLGGCWWLIERWWAGKRALSIVFSSVVVVGMLSVIFAAYKLVGYTPTRDDAATPLTAEELAAAGMVQAAAAGTLVADSAFPATSASSQVENPWHGPEPESDSITAALQFICYDRLELGKNSGHPADLMLNWGLEMRALFAQQDPLTPEQAIQQYHTNALAPVIAIFEFTGRDGRLLSACFDHFSEYLHLVLPQAVFRSSRASYYVDKLLATHDLLQEQSGYRESLAGLYEKMKQGANNGEPQAETYIADIGWAGSLRSIDPALARGDQYGNRLSVWLVSFWARRYQEGNAGDVYDILQKLAAHYGGD
ncbi:hypothetical protein [Chitinophaga flava]|uniref:Uncharacterized protein n=1 Tax=Chitinophaga flava TaxID=2259036 RepID=A0A365XPN9_9BACT|nr:hypothetical protein [Chitinophaga flava]RBL88309.1 hypothetical protein DF182_17070 [Chitinophaga flava]